MEEQQKNMPPQEERQWGYQSGQLEQQGGLGADQQTANSADQQPDAIISWTASEFISHEKNNSWYMFLAGGAIVLSAVIFLITREYFSIIVVAVLAIALGVFGAIKPRTLDYAIFPGGIQVGEKHFVFEMFRSFSVIEDGAVPSIQLLPQKRFMVPITIYFAPNDADTIVEALGDFLPNEQRKHDLVDRISSRIRF